jgi:recombination associated protein RdgC
MFFRNLQIFRLTSGWAYSPEQLAERMAAGKFSPCSALARHSQGWVPPRGNPDELVFVSAQQMMITLGIEQKILPVSVIRQYTQERAAEQEDLLGMKPGRKMLRDIFDAVEAELLPRAFCKRRLTYAWIDPVGGWLVIDAGSASKADEVIEQLKLTLGELPISLFKTVQAPGTAMTTWLSVGEVPGPFSIDQDCELRTAGDSGGKVKYTRHPLDSEEVGQHIGRGKVAGKLAMTWNDRISFVLTEQMQIKRVEFLDVLKEQAEKHGENCLDQHEADFAIMTGELAGMLAALGEALGGEVEREPQGDTKTKQMFDGGEA